MDQLVLAIITANKAAIFVDGRYTLQVQNQVDNTLYSYEHLTGPPCNGMGSEKPLSRNTLSL